MTKVKFIARKSRALGKELCLLQMNQALAELPQEHNP